MIPLKRSHEPRKLIFHFISLTLQGTNGHLIEGCHASGRGGQSVCFVIHQNISSGFVDRRHITELTLGVVRGFNLHHDYGLRLIDVASMTRNIVCSGRDPL
ncbi:hypothetical protein CEXT_15411 [Caerostris extrusa]|uniref:Uncharacterized protein n=1 Tax=Caerostris extrusa TaxID=172846 RepID=A0AAV4VD42_CAEEX|nr:hypothetical protein CEXT_15411 [Caerostris extrusa]